MQDLRRSPRYSLRWPVTLLLGEASSGLMAGGRVLDISMDGASILSDLHVRDIDQLTLILLPPPRCPEEARTMITIVAALICSVHSDEHRCFRAGLRFVHFEGAGRDVLEERLGRHSPVFERS